MRTLAEWCTLPPPGVLTQCSVSVVKMHNHPMIQAYGNHGAHNVATRNCASDGRGMKADRFECIIAKSFFALAKNPGPLIWERGGSPLAVASISNLNRHCIYRGWDNTTNWRCPCFDYSTLKPRNVKNSGSPQFENIRIFR